MNPQTINVLFLCTHNSARSILAEATLNHIGKGRFKAYSAGSSPRQNQQPHPLALEVLHSAGVSTEGLHSKSWDAFGNPDAPHMDIVITVCDNAAGEVCPFGPASRPRRTGVMRTPRKATARRRKNARLSVRRCMRYAAGWTCWSTCRRPGSTSSCCKPARAS
jgi:protein-tyrosine-phosphatase